MAIQKFFYTGGLTLIKQTINTTGNQDEILISPNICFNSVAIKAEEGTIWTLYAKIAPDAEWVPASVDAVQQDGSKLFSNIGTCVAIYLEVETIVGEIVLNATYV